MNWLIWIVVVVGILAVLYIIAQALLDPEMPGEKKAAMIFFVVLIVLAFIGAIVLFSRWW